MPQHFDTSTTAPTTFGMTSSRQMVSCRVCGRTLLMGERSTGFFTTSGEGPFDVCELCVPRAHRFGLRPHQSTADEVGRARRAGALHKVIDSIGAITSGKRVAAARVRRARPEIEPGGAPGIAVVAAQQAAGAAVGTRRMRRRAAAAAAAPMDSFALGTVPFGSAAIPVGLAAFNQSPHARTLAGLYRTLGAPRASVAPRSATDREIIITVAWEIVWYQFRVMPDGIEQHRGQYLSDLQSRWQRWNCAVNPDGTVSESGEVTPDLGHDEFQTAPVEGPTR